MFTILSFKTQQLFPKINLWNIWWLSFFLLPDWNFVGCFHGSDATLCCGWGSSEWKSIKLQRKEAPVGADGNNIARHLPSVMVPISTNEIHRRTTLNQLQRWPSNNCFKRFIKSKPASQGKAVKRRFCTFSNLGHHLNINRERISCNNCFQLHSYLQLERGKCTHISIGAEKYKQSL